MKKFTAWAVMLTSWLPLVYKHLVKKFWTAVWYRYNVRVRYDAGGGWKVLPDSRPRVQQVKGSYVIKGYKRRTTIPMDKVLSITAEDRPRPLSQEDFRPIRGRRRHVAAGR